MPKNKLRAAQNTACPACGYAIPPAEILRVSTQEMKCPKCGVVFVPGNLAARELARSLREGSEDSLSSSVHQFI